MPPHHALLINFGIFQIQLIPHSIVCTCMSIECEAMARLGLPSVLLVALLAFGALSGAKQW